MRKTIEITLQELLHAINILGDDRDVTVDGIDSIAVCAPVKMTPAGRKHFEQALTANVIVEYKDDSYQQSYVSDADEKIEKWLGVYSALFPDTAMLTTMTSGLREMRQKSFKSKRIINIQL